MNPESWVWVPFEVERQFDGFRVDRFLSQRLAAYSRGRVQKILEASRVMRDERLIKASSRVHFGDRILIAYPRRPEEPLTERDTIPVLFEDASLVVINKPADLLSHPTDKVALHTVLGVMRHCRPDLGPLHLLHRLDRETSGVLVLGKNRIAARGWTETMESRKVKKEYLAIVRGTPRRAKGVLNQPIGRAGGVIKVQQAIHGIGSVPAVTRYEIHHVFRPVRTNQPDASFEKQVESCAVVRVFPETGRLHQIRVHLAAMGHPILGDVLYNGDGSMYLKMTQHKLAPGEREKLGFPRLALHAARIRFPHPITAQAIEVSAPLPSDMAKFLDTLSPADEKTAL